MRYTRMGKSTHQRVADDATPWETLKSTPAKPSNQRKGKIQNTGVAGQKRKIQKGSDEGAAGKRQKFSKPMQREPVESANFTPIGERPGGKKVLGSGANKQVKIQGQFWVPAEEAKRLNGLAKKLKEQGMTKKEISEALKYERRRAEKTARRARDKTCFNCRQFGHILENCPTVKNQAESDDPKTTTDQISGVGTGLCFKCGSTEHMSRDCKKKADKFDYAKCFVCSETGHISRQCPKNKKGRFPIGGACKICDDVTHFAKDCPKAEENQKAGEGKEVDAPIVARMSNPFASLEYEDNFEIDSGNNIQQPKTKNRKVKF